MAKIGEGDKRWIVEDRADGANVHNWHWAETDCVDWSRNFLKNLLSNKTIISGEGNLYIKTKDIEKLEGEAYLNVRKGKIIPGYELNLVLSYEAEVKDSDGSSVILNTEGTVEVPYIADENAGEDPEIRISVKDDGPIGKRVKEAFIAQGKPFVFEKIRDFVNAMAKGGPAKDGLEVKKVTVKKPAFDSGSAAGSSNISASNSGSSVRESKKKQEKRKEGFKTITMTEKFICRAKDLYEILMDENRWKGFTQSNARISKEVGGEFSIFDGSVTGKNVELLEGKLIFQNWRFGSWPDGIESTIEYPSILRFDVFKLSVRLSFDDPESGVTVVKLTHTDVPEEDRYGNVTVVENTERGWREIIFHRIRAVFGFGM